ncbi:MAG: hypothetical protein R3B96_15465 [Pirellulaceae bacterium]
MKGRLAEQESLRKLQHSRGEELEQQIGPLRRQYHAHADVMPNSSGNSMPMNRS